MISFGASTRRLRYLASNRSKASSQTVGPQYPSIKCKRADPSGNSLELLSKNIYEEHPDNARMMFKQSTSYARYLNVLLLCPTTPYLRSYATAVSHSVLLFLRADDSYNTGYHTGCRRYFPVCPFPFCFGEDRFSLSMTSALPNNLLIQSTQIWYSTFRCVQFQQSSKSNE